VVERTHSTFFHFVKQPRYFAAVDEVREPQTDYALKYFGPGKGERYRKEKEQRRIGEGVQQSAYRVNPLGKLPGSVWTDLSWDQVVERIVKGWAPKDGALVIQGTDSLPLGVRT
jgi:hypothetical protein